MNFLSQNRLIAGPWQVIVTAWAMSILVATGAAGDTLNVAATAGWDVYRPKIDWGYRYGPSIIINPDDSIDIWTAAPPVYTGWDAIRHKRSLDGGHTWGTEAITLLPTPGSRDTLSVCDPGVVQFGGYYYIGYTSTEDQRGLNNHVYVARSTTPEGGFEKWDGSGWGGDPQPFIEYDGGSSAWGAGEPSFVVKDDVLHVYYTWDSETVSETRVATVSASDPNWPANITQRGTALSRFAGEDSTDVKYIEAYDKFIGVGVASRFSADAYIHVWESSDGITFTPVDEILQSEGIQDWSHNAGISGTPEGHLNLNDNNVIGYAYSENDTVSWGLWATHFNPITITGPMLTPGDANGDGSVDSADAAILAVNWQTQGSASWSMGDFNFDDNVDDVDATLLAVNWQQGSRGIPAIPEPSMMTLLVGLVFMLGFVAKPSPHAMK